jgi:hypothetical protein
MNKPRAATQDLNAKQNRAAWVARFVKAPGIDRVFGLQAEKAFRSLIVAAHRILPTQGIKHMHGNHTPSP